MKLIAPVAEVRVPKSGDIMVTPDGVFAVGEYIEDGRLCGYPIDAMGVIAPDDFAVLKDYDLYSQDEYELHMVKK